MILTNSPQFGVIYSELFDGGVNSEIVSEGLAKVSEKWCNKQPLIVYDNARCNNVDLKGLP